MPRLDERTDFSWIERTALASILLLLAVLAMRQISSLDVGFHLRGGESILAGEGWPANDRFTYTLGHRAYIDTSWGYQLLLAAVYRFGGPPALVLLHAAWVLVLFAILLATARLDRVEPSALLAVFLLGGFACEMRFAVRPELLSYVLLAGVIYLLQRYRLRGSAPLYLLPCIFLLWVNCHSLFILGWAALGAFWAGDLLLNRRPDLRLSLWGLASIAITLINPYGWRALVFPFTLATRLEKANAFAQTIGEFLSPLELGRSGTLPFYPRLTILAYFLFALLVVPAGVSMLRKKNFGSLLLSLAFLWLSMRMVRNIPLVVIAAFPGLCWSLQLSPLVERWIGGRRRLVRATVAAAVLVASVLLCLRVYHDAHYVSSRRKERFGLDWNTATQPRDAARFIRNSGLEGPMLNHLNFGGYFMSFLPEPVFIDGRLEVVGEEFYGEYQQILGSEQGLEDAQRRYGFGWIAFPYQTNPRLTRRLSGDRRWIAVYVDNLALVFARVREGSPPPQIDPALKVLDRSVALPVDVAALPGIGGNPRSRPGILRWFGGALRTREFPEEDFAMGLFELFRGRTGHAAGRFARAIRDSDGAYYEIYNNLGAALFRLERWEEAARCYEVVLREVPSNAMARKRLDAARARAPNP